MEHKQGARKNGRNGKNRKTLQTGIAHRANQIGTFQNKRKYYNFTQPVKLHKNKHNNTNNNQNSTQNATNKTVPPQGETHNARRGKQPSPNINGGDI